MGKKRIAIVGYGTIGERISDGVSLQDDMEVAGIVDVAATLPVRALIESGKGYPVYAATEEAKPALEKAGIPVKGLMTDLLKESDVVVDATSPGIGAKNKEVYMQFKVPAIFQAGEKHGVGQNLLHPMANYDQCRKLRYIQMLSCNTTGIARQAYTSDRAWGLIEMISVITRRAADISETHKGPVDALLPEKVPSHQCEDFSMISPHIKAITTVITAPVSHGHATTMIFDVRKKTTKEEVTEIFNREPRIRIFRLDDGFISTSHIFDYCRDKGSPRGDMYEVPVWEETIFVDHDGTRVYSINMIPQEAIVIPENIDGIRCILGLEATGDEAMAHTNKGLGIA